MSEKLGHDQAASVAFERLGVLGLASVLFESASAPTGIGRVNCLRIRPGMSQHQVEAILGLPPGDYRSAGQARRLCESWLHLPGQTRQDWYGDAGDIRVVFDQHRRVASRQWIPGSATAMDTMLRWLDR